MEFIRFSLFTIGYIDGTEILTSNINIANIDNKLTIKFKLPDNYLGILYFTLVVAYDGIEVLKDY